jgi:predicted RNA binding protein YcfA (HicA-like mRNA interferase family)
VHAQDALRRAFRAENEHATRREPVTTARKTNRGIVEAFRSIGAPPETAVRSAGRRTALVKVRDVIRLLASDGWIIAVTRGRHRQFKHPVKRGRVTVSGGLGDEMPRGTLRSVLRQAGLKRGRP